MTKEQSAIIDSLIEEFNKISKKSGEKKAFNLIDIGPIQEKIMVKQQWRDKHERLKIEWEQHANREAHRIVDLLRLDLLGLTIYKLAKQNGHIDCPTIRVGHNSDWERIEVVVDNVLVTDPYGDGWHMPVRLKYEVFGHVYETIEEAMTNDRFIERVRKFLTDKK